MTLTYLFWELARNPSWQDRLHEELAQISPEDGSDVPAYSEVANLPLLDATIQEALRLHPAAPASLPRETPLGGKVLAGHHIPEGVSLVTIQIPTLPLPLSFPKSIPKSIPQDHPPPFFPTSLLTPNPLENTRPSSPCNATRPNAPPPPSPTPTPSTHPAGSTAKKRPL